MVVLRARRRLVGGLALHPRYRALSTVPGSLDGSVELGNAILVILGVVLVHYIVLQVSTKTFLQNVI